MKDATRAILIGMTALFMSVSAKAESEDGSAEHPYQIGSEADLAKIVEHGMGASGRGVCFEQTADIALTKPWVGIGTYKSSTDCFSGIFDGKNHKISAVVMADNGSGQNNYRGFFNQVDGGTVKNLTVETSGFGATPPSGEYGCAVIVGAAYNATIENCVAEGTIASGTHNVGGIAVRIKDTAIIDCTNKAKITGSYTKVAGICVISQESTTGCVIGGCINEGAITAANGTDAGRDGIGGIIAYVDDIRLTIKDCENKGTVAKGAGASSSARVGQIVAYGCYGVTEFQGTIKGAADVRMVGDANGRAIDRHLATVTGSVATFLPDSEVEVAGTYKAMATGGAVTLANIGDSITIDTSLAAVDVTTTAEDAEVSRSGDLYTVKAVRSVSVVSFNAETGAASLAFGSTASASLLYAVVDKGDRGVADAEAWSKAAYLGNIPGATTEGEYTVPSAWLAEPCVIRFVLTTEHERPYDAELNYIVSESSGNLSDLAYVDTGIVPDSTTSIEVKFVQRNVDAAAFGVSGAFYLFSNGQVTFYGYFGDADKSNGSFDNFNLDNNRAYTLRLGPDGAYVDGVRKVGPFKSPTVTTASTLTIGARRVDGQTTVAKQGYFRLYGAKVTKGGRLVCDYIPVRKGDVRCFYDRISKELYDSKGTKKFTKTNSGEVEIGSDLPTDVAGWSTPVRVGRTVQVKSFSSATGEASLKLTGGSWSGRIFVLHDVEDRGSEPSNWAACAYLARVEGATTDCSLTIPSEWAGVEGAVRFVWASDVESPYDCELSSVVSRGTQEEDNRSSPIVDTQIFPTLDTKVSVYTWMPAQTADCAFGLSKVIYLFTPNGNDDFYYGFHSERSNKPGTGKYFDVWHTLTVGPEGAYVDDLRVAGPFGSATAENKVYESLTLFCRRNNDTGAQEKRDWRRAIKTAKIWEKNRLVRDYIACSKDGLPYLYDRVNGTFSGGENFYPGNELEPALAGSEPLALSRAVHVVGPGLILLIR